MWADRLIAIFVISIGSAVALSCLAAAYAICRCAIMWDC